MRNLLSDYDIKKMDEELEKDLKLLPIPPVNGREYWNVHRIVATLKYFQGIEKRYYKEIKWIIK